MISKSIEIAHTALVSSTLVLKIVNETPKSMTKTNIIRTLKSFLLELEKDHIIKIKSAYLFGSVVNGKNTKYSDIDLAIVSDSFTGCRYDDRVKLNPYILKINTSLEVHPFTTKEFKTDNPFAKEIIKNGERIL